MIYLSDVLFPAFWPPISRSVFLATDKPLGFIPTDGGKQKSPDYHSRRPIKAIAGQSGLV